VQVLSRRDITVAAYKQSSTSFSRVPVRTTTTTTKTTTTPPTTSSVLTSLASAT